MRAHGARNATPRDFHHGLLGVMYAKGEGVPRDYLLAYMWLNLGVSNFTEDNARERTLKVLNELENNMTQEQISEAQRLSREWKPKGKNY